MSIKLKVALLTTSWLIGILLVVNITVYFTFLRIATDNEMDWFSKRGDTLLEKATSAELFQANHNELLQNFLPDNGMIRILDATGQEVKVFTSDDALRSIQPAAVSVKQTQLVSDGSEPVLIMRAPIVIDGRVVGTLEMAEKLDTLKENINVLISILVFSTLGAIGLSLLGGTLLSRWLLRPISKMAQTMEDIEQSLVFRKIPSRKGSKDELAALAATFNRMMDRIEESFIRQRQFVSDASHELKTPLTIIEGYADLLRRWGLKDEKNGREAVESIYSEAGRMKQMTQQLLDLASTEQGDPAKERLDLVSICHATVDLLRKLYPRQIEVVALSPTVPLEADPLHIEQLLLILLDNAIKYSQQSIEVELTIVNDSRGAPLGVEIKVKDRGVGIPKDELAHVFERFYRVDPSRGRKTGGTGLGLSIARNIVRLYGGSIEIRSEEHVGTEVIVFFPDEG